MGDKSTSAGEASIELASPAAVKYKSAQDAVFENSKFTIRIPNAYGLVFFILLVAIYFL